MVGSLHVVATPIGNLEDISERAVKLLASSDLVVAEDTRHTGRLLARLGIDTPLRSLHEHSDASVVDDLLERIRQGQRLALVSDAGTPLISDPGFELVRACRREGVAVFPVPGPNAAIAALSVSGLPSDRFRFCGFPPGRSGARRKWLQSVGAGTETQVLYESTHRIAETLREANETLGPERPAFLAREMTKLHEQHHHGTLATLVQALDDGQITLKGEFCLVLGGAGASAEDGDVEEQAVRLLSLLSGQMSPSHAARTAAAFTGLTRQRCYELAEDLKSGQE